MERNKRERARLGMRRLSFHSFQARYNDGQRENMASKIWRDSGPTFVVNKNTKFVYFILLLKITSVVML